MTLYDDPWAGPPEHVLHGDRATSVRFSIVSSHVQSSCTWWVLN